MEEERGLRIGIIVAGHLMWLSAAALRVVRGERGHRIASTAPWWIQYYPPLVWLPLLIAVFGRPLQLDLSDPLPLTGLVVAVASALLAAWSMWSLGRSYGIRMDLFEGHELKTSGPYAVCRHPMYLGVIGYHVGASLALESLFLLAITAFYVVPFTAVRIAAEDRVLAEGFGRRFEEYRSRVPALLPLPR